MREKLVAQELKVHLTVDDVAGPGKNPKKRGARSGATEK